VACSTRDADLSTTVRAILDQVAMEATRPAGSPPRDLIRTALGERVALLDAETAALVAPIPPR
jgi:hypothetical protein